MKRLLILALLLAPPASAQTFSTANQPPISVTIQPSEPCFFQYEGTCFYYQEVAAVTPAEAPKRVKVTKKRVLQKIVKAAVIWGAPAASSLLATKGGVDCRNRVGVEHCTARYGEFNGTEAMRGTVSVSMSAATWGCLKETNWKGCYGIATGTTAYNLLVWRDQEEKRGRK